MSDVEALFDDVGWVTLTEACEASGASRSTLRAWYRSGRIPSRMAEGRHGPERLVPLDVVLEEAQHSPRLWKKAADAVHEAADVTVLQNRVAELERRVSELEQLLQKRVDDLVVAPVDHDDVGIDSLESE
jgi:predicted site-specific integrase-resolvase